MPEPDEGQLSRPVLRGGGYGNVTPLPARPGLTPRLRSLLLTRLHSPYAMRVARAVTGRFADDEARLWRSRFPTPFTLVYRCWKSLKKPPFSPLLGPFGVPSTRDGWLRKPFSRQHIGTEMSPSGRSGNLVAEEPRNCH